MTTTKRRPARGVAIWVVAALLGYALYSEHTEAAIVEQAIDSKLETNASARRALLIARMGYIGIDDLEANARECLKATKKTGRR